MAGEMKRVFLGLGSNLGDPARQLAEAVCRLGRRPGLELRKVSALYTTEPVGPPGQDWYVNAVVEGSTALAPQALLAGCKQVEAEMGRKPAQRWGPRLIDIDLLWMEDCQLEVPGLTVPHPQLEKRAFVLIPLLTLAPDLCLPSGRTVVATVAALSDPHQVRPYLP